MKIASNIIGGLLGLAFIAFSLIFLLQVFPIPPQPEGTPTAHFMAALLPTGYMTFVKVLELIGGCLVAIPKTRNFGLLVLGPIILNILAFHVFIAKGEGLFVPLVIVAAPALFLLWAGRKAFAGLMN